MLLQHHSKKAPLIMAVAARTPLVDSSKAARQQPTNQQKQQQRPSATNQNQPLADHRYQQRRQRDEFLLDAAVVVGSAHSSAPPIAIGQRRSSSVGDDVIAVGDAVAAEISPIFSLASFSNNQIFFDDLNHHANFFNECCEPISPAATVFKATLHQQSSFDVTPPRIDFPLYTASAGGSLSDSGGSPSSLCGGSLCNSPPGPNNKNYPYSAWGSNNICYSASGPNSNYSPLSEPRGNFNSNFCAIDSDSSSSSPVWHDQFLNINELLPQNNNFDPIFGGQSSSFDDFLLSIAQHEQQQHENHVTDITNGGDQSASGSPSRLRKSYDRVIFPDEEGGGPPIAAIETERGGGASHSADQSYFAAAGATARRSITIDEERRAEEAELKKTPPLFKNLAAAAAAGYHHRLDQSEEFKNQQQILEEIYRECEKHVKIFRPQSEIDQSAETSPPAMYRQPIVHLDLDDEVTSSSSPPISVSDATMTPPTAVAAAFPLVEREIRSSRDYDDEQPIKKKRGKLLQQQQRHVDDDVTTTTISSAPFYSSPVVADWLSSDVDEEQQQTNDDNDTLDVIDVRKRRQNRKAASKYRTKRKIQKISVESERSRLEAENYRLRSIVGDRQREIDYLRKFLDEIRGASSNKSKIGRN